MATIISTVTVDLDELTSLLESAISRALQNARVYERAGIICPDAVARVTASLAASGRIERTAS